MLLCTEKPVERWLRPYQVTDSKGKQLTLNTGTRILGASIDKDKLYVERNVNDHEADPSEVDLCSNNKVEKQSLQLQSIIDAINENGSRTHGVDEKNHNNTKKDDTNDKSGKEKQKCSPSWRGKADG